MTQKQPQPHQLADCAFHLTDKATPLTADDEFAMPVVEMDLKRDYSEFVGRELRGKGVLQGFNIATMFENIRFRID